VLIGPPSNSSTSNTPFLPPPTQFFQNVNVAPPPGQPPLVDTNVNLLPTPPSTPGSGPGVGPQTTGSIQLVAGGPINNPERLDVGDGRYFYLPPAEETRLATDEVVVQLACDTPQQAIDTALSQAEMSVLSSQCLADNVAIYRLRNGGNNRQLPAAIRALAEHRIFASGQANYVYTLGQARQREGDASQYVLDKLRLPDIHRTLRATNVPVAVIDSEIDASHPDLDGVIVNRFNATGVEERPHPHGTGMAGAIASHRRVVGTAPGAQILAIRAFSTKAANAESTTFNILKGLDYAINNNVRIVNMSFAGPRDPTLERALAAAYDKGVVLVAAAGNAGPKSPPLFPAADKHVIAVTATDIDDKLFTGANRGAHITVAAPGVDILVPAPSGAYQMTTGTSVATAHVSGIVALMLERNPALTPADVKRILAASAKKLGPNDQFGAGLIDPAKALQLAAPRTSEAPAPVRR
jgi:subtilisin family serine protease